MRDAERHARIEADHVVGDLLRRRPVDLAAKAGLSALQVAFCHLKACEGTLG